MHSTSMGNRTVSTMLMRELQAATSPTTTVAAGRLPCELKRTKLLMMSTCDAHSIQYLMVVDGLPPLQARSVTCVLSCRSHQAPIIMQPYKQ